MNKTYDFIARNEGVRKRVYLDTEGHPTIGIGFNLDRSDADALLDSVGVKDKRGIRNGTCTLCRCQIEDLADVTIKEAVGIARHLFPGFDSYSTGRKRALTDMAFNLGQTRLSKFIRMRSAVNAGDWGLAAKEARDSKWARQVGSRADRVIALLIGE